MQQCTLGHTGGSRRVLNLRIVIGRDFRQSASLARPTSNLTIPVFEVDCQNLLSRNRNRLGRHRCHVTAAELSGVEEPAGLGLRQDVREFLRTQRRIGSHQNHSGERGAVLQDHPLRNVRSPDGDPVSAIELGQEVVRTPLRFVLAVARRSTCDRFRRPRTTNAIAPELLL